MSCLSFLVCNNKLFVDKLACLFPLKLSTLPEMLCYESNKFYEGISVLNKISFLVFFFFFGSVHPGLHASYHQSAFGPMQPLSRSQQSVATSAAAAAAAAGVNPMQIMEHPRLIFQPTAAALGVGGKNKLLVGGGFFNLLCG